MARRVVITGALGHIGSRLIRHKEITSRFEEIVMIDDMSTQRYSSVMNLSPSRRVVLLEGPVTEKLTPALLNPETVVVHLAARTESSTSMFHSETIFENNLKSTSHVLLACKAADAALIFPSSSSIYKPVAGLVSEHSAIAPATPYASCKCAEEDLIADFRASGLRACILRFGTIFGVSPGMRFHTAVNKFCWEAVTRGSVEIWQHAEKQLRPYLSVGDACSAIAHVIKSECYGIGTVNVSTTNATVQQVLTAIESSGINLTTRIVESPASSPNSIELDTSLAHRLGFSFVDNLENGVEETVSLFRSLTQARPV